MTARQAARLNAGMFVISVGLLITGALLLSGCATAPGGTIGMIQTMDDSLAAKYGVPASVVSKVRSALGIIDVRTLPSADRVLPAGATWTRDILNASNQVVDLTGYHYGPPRVVLTGDYSTPPVTAGSLLPSMTSTNGVALLEGLLDIIGKNPDLLKPAK